MTTLWTGDLWMTIRKLPKIGTQKQFMDVLGEMIAIQRYEEQNVGDIGRPRDLKSYIFETDEKLEERFVVDDVKVNIENTSLDHIKILTMAEITTNKPRSVQFYLDKSDDRFLVLHTNELATDSDHFVKKLTQSNDHKFDSAWLSTSMLRSISTAHGNNFYGYGVNYTDIFCEDNDLIEPPTKLKMSISGTISQKVLETIKKDREVDKALGYTKITIGRGTKNHGVLEDLKYNGRFRVMKGDSIDDHISLVGHVTDEYSKKIHNIENERIRGERDGNRCFIEGTSFDFELDHAIDDWGKYLPKIFNALEPFRIWGMKNKIERNVYKILGVDMHTGDPLDIEVDTHIMRVYLPKNSCGNVILRLFVNLQRFLDSKIICSQIE